MNNQEIECTQILHGLDQLYSYLEQPIAKDALDLDKNASTVKNKELLQRLKRSLLQYADRGKNLAYIGFMGHFSTGKSSTINSILELEKK